jgi:membrane protease YdiL (CAAX protease family)
MQSNRRFATAHPLPFVILATVAWMVVAGVAAFAAARILRTPFVGKMAQSVGMLAATGCLLWVMGRWGWLRAAGITVPGGRRLWLVTAGLAAYVVIAYQFGFFHGIALDTTLVWDSGEAQAILARQAVVGIAEEFLFRGLLVCALVRAWGDTRRGLLAAVTVPALVFGLLHILQASTGNPLDDTLMTMVNAFVGGVWCGALVLLGGSIWPAVLIHAMTNATAQIGGASLTGFDPAVMDYAWATAAEVPLVIASLWLLLRRAPGPVSGERKEGHAGAPAASSIVTRLTPPLAPRIGKR